MTGDEREGIDHKAKSEKNSAIVTFTEHFADLALINLYWFISILFVLPLFAATEALFYCISLVVKRVDFNISRTFFTYVKEHFFESMKRGILFVFLFIVLLIDGFIVFSMPEGSLLKMFLLGALVVLSLLFFFIFFYYGTLYMFTDWVFKKRLIMSIYLCVRYFYYTVIVLLVTIGQFLLSLYFVPLFFFFSLSFPAYCFAMVVDNTFKQKNPYFGIRD